MAKPEDQPVFEREVAAVRTGGALGRSQALLQLFDYLADQARAGRPLREADVAQDVFGRGGELSGDASVRVYIHRLRKKLEQHYGARPGPRLGIPLGEYRLELTGAAEPPQPRTKPLRLGLIGLLLLAGLIGAMAWWSARSAAAPLWRGVGQDRPVTVAVGDYYIFGDTEGTDRPQRMIREFDVNGSADLDALLTAQPELEGRYVDLDTYYTPVGATLALRQVLPAAARAARRPERLRLITASKLDAAALKGSDIVYVGLLSGLGPLEPLVFAGARFRRGDTYDEVVDTRTGRTFTSSAGTAGGARANQDLAYLAAFRRPTGERLVIIAGARDMGVVQAAELALEAKTVASLAERDGRREGLFEVEGLGRTAMSARPAAP